jgi:hypothetical protein
MSAFAGFDSSAFPGLAVTSWLKVNTNLVWCGFYLGPTPSHTGHDWMPHRANLVAQGWGLAPLYVGQQVTGPGSKHSTLAQGTIDGNDAVALMTSAGFSPGHFVYLDLENGAPFTHAQHDYVAGWVDAVEAGGFGAGVYCSHTFADQVHVLRSSARIWAFKVPTTTLHPIPGNNFPTSHPSGSGYTGSYAWQLAQNGWITVPPAPGSRLTVDLDTSVSPDPGN